MFEKKSWFLFLLRREKYSIVYGYRFKHTAYCFKNTAIRQLIPAIRLLFKKITLDAVRYSFFFNP